MINWRDLFGLGNKPETKELVIPLETTVVVLNMNYGQKFRQAFRGGSGVTSEEVARRWIRESGNWFDIGGGKFVNVQDIREITLEKK